MRASSLLLLTCIAGCQASADPSPPPARDLAAKVVALRERMHVRFAATNGVRTAISLGDLDRAHAEARTVAQLDEPDVLPAWRPYVDDIRAAAAQIVLAKDTVTAAKTMATLGRECAACHEAVPSTKKIVFPKVAPPREDPRLPSQMAGHQWAAARMWEGLIGPSTPLWLEGSSALAKAPLTITAEASEPGHDLGIADDVARVRVFATRAQKAQTLDDRAQIYGELLATCAHCHYTIRDR
jgi:cytochrome c553